MFRGRDDWFDLWVEDKSSIFNTMVANLKANLDAGYDSFGQNVTKQRQDIEDYSQKFNKQLDEFAKMTEEEINRWCYFSLFKSGAISK